jgi:ABC-type proline/glycine betaine transport system substrate-binding protein
MKKLLTVFSLFFVVGMLGACETEDTIIVAQADWESIEFHNEVVRILIEEGYGVKVETVPADTAVMVAGLRTSDIDLSMEVWSDNIPTYQEELEAGNFVELSVNFDDNKQGLYIPRYLYEQYSGLRTVRDLIDYVHLFPNPEGGDKGIIYGGPDGWSATEFLELKMKAYGLDEYFEFRTIDSSATLNATLAGAYANEEPWVGYNWEPTWALGLFDLVLLDDEPFTEEDFVQGIGAFPTVRVTVAVDRTFEDRYPEITEFLRNYTTSSDITSEALAYMQENSVEADAAARWFLINYESLWTSWVPTEVADRVKASLNA